MSYTTKSESVANLKGRRIQYRKVGSRNGWTGTIKSTWPDPGMPGGYAVNIRYDNGIEQKYCIEALEGFGVPVMYENAAGYLRFIDDRAEIWNFIIVNETTGQIDGSADLLPDAERIAESMVKETRGSYRIYKSYCTARIDEPPVLFSRTPID